MSSSFSSISLALTKSGLQAADGNRELMLPGRIIIAGLKEPALAIVWLRRFVLFGGVQRDPECMHLVNAWSNGTLQRVELRAIFPGIDMYVQEVVVRQPESRTIGWSLDLSELVHILSVVKFTNAKRVLEIGTFDGFTALNLAANIGRDGELSTVDLPQDKSAELKAIPNAVASHVVGSKFRGQQEASQIRQLWVDSTKADWNSLCSVSDLILVDGCHDYAYVKADSAKAVKHVRPGGTVFWHDYGQSRGVTKAIDELSHRYSIVAIKGTRLACFRKPSC